MEEIPSFSKIQRSSESQREERETEATEKLRIPKSLRFQSPIAILEGMKMDRQFNNSTSSSEDGSRGSSTSLSSSNPVVAIECVAGSSKAEEWNGNMLQSGDIVEEIRIGDSISVRAPFKHGKNGVQKLLNGSFKKGETSILVRVRRGREEFVELVACIVPHEVAGKRQYVLRSIHDPNYAVGFVDRLERECLEMQGSRSTRVVNALSRAQLQDGYVSYGWEKKMRESLPIQYSSCFLSLLILPRSTDPSHAQYHTLEDTLARANSWLNSAQASGVPIVFMNVQTEALLTKISGETASSTVSAGSVNDLASLANASLYGFEDYHGVDIGVVKAVRLWYTPVAGEYAIEIKLLEGDSKLGFAVSRTEEGFIFISSVIDDDDPSLPSTRSGLRALYREATRAGKLIIISRVANEKVLPWMVSPAGAIRCYDTVSLSQKLSLHRHAIQSILIHVLMWDREIRPPPPQVAEGRGGRRPPRPVPPSAVMPPPPDQLMQNISLNDEARIVRDNSGEASFRFIDFPISNSWV